MYLQAYSNFIILQGHKLGILSQWLKNSKITKIVQSLNSLLTEIVYNITFFLLFKSLWFTLREEQMQVFELLVINANI